MSHANPNEFTLVISAYHIEKARLKIQQAKLTIMQIIGIPEEDAAQAISLHEEFEVAVAHLDLVIENIQSISLHEELEVAVAHLDLIIENIQFLKDQIT